VLPGRLANQQEDSRLRRDCPPGVSDAILKIFDILGKRDDTPTEIRSDGAPSPELTAKIAKLDAWYTTVEVSDQEFDKRVTEHLREYAKSNTALQAALDNGSAHIQRAEDVEGFNYHLNMTFQYGDYELKQGAVLKPDYSQAFLQRERAEGGSWLVGWAGGGIGSYYVTY
jgi:hypothetical protein